MKWLEMQVAAFGAALYAVSEVQCPVLDAAMTPLNSTL
jgi:hypothetical protein